MKRQLSALLVAPLLLAPKAVAADAAAKGRSIEYVAASYATGGGGRHLSELGVHYELGRFELGWRFRWTAHTGQSPAIRGDRVTVGPLWSLRVLKVGEGGLRGGIAPWFSVSTKVKDTNGVVISLPYGGEWNVTADGSVRLGRSLRVLPSVAVVGESVKFTQQTDPALTGWDWQVGWRVALPMWIGAGEKVRFEVAYTGSLREATYLAQRRLEIGLGMAF